MNLHAGDNQIMEVDSYLRRATGKRPAGGRAAAAGAGRRIAQRQLAARGLKIRISNLRSSQERVDLPVHGDGAAEVAPARLSRTVNTFPEGHRVFICRHPGHLEREASHGDGGLLTVGHRAYVCLHPVHSFIRKSSGKTAAGLPPLGLLLLGASIVMAGLACSSMST